MKLYQEIILLDQWFDGYYVVENVKPYYDPLIEPQVLGRHCFWSNLDLTNPPKFTPRGNFDDTEKMAASMGYDLSTLKNVNKKLVLRNCVENDISEFIYERLKEQID